MAILAQGSNVYVLVRKLEASGQPVTPKTLEVMEIECATTFNPGGNPADQIEVTCLSDTTRRYVPGLRTPGQASFTIYADPNSASHLRLYALSESDDAEDKDLAFAIGWADGKAAPTVNAAGDDFDLPATRTWFTFRGYMSDFPFDFSQNTNVTTAATVQRTGPGVWLKKA